MINQPKPTPESELKDKANFFKLYLERGEILFKRDSEISSLKAEYQLLRDKHEADRIEYQKRIDDLEKENDKIRDQYSQDSQSSSKRIEELEEENEILKAKDGEMEKVINYLRDISPHYEAQWSITRYELQKCIKALESCTYYTGTGTSQKFDHNLVQAAITSAKSVLSGTTTSSQYVKQEDLEIVFLGIDAQIERNQKAVDAALNEESRSFSKGVVAGLNLVRKSLEEFRRME